MSSVGPRDLPSSLSAIEDLRAFAGIKLLALDLDGTLLRAFDHRPGERLEHLEHSFRRQQTITTVATGRTLFGIRLILDALPSLRKIPIILYNGSLVVIPEGPLVLRHVTMSSETARGVGEAVVTAGAEAFFYYFNNEPSLLDGSLWPETVYALGGIATEKVDINGLSVQHVALQELPNSGPIAILVRGGNANLREVLKNITGVDITASGDQYTELRPKGSNKAEGLEIAAKHLSVPREKVLALGDNDNDVEMLQWAGIGVAISSATEKARQASNFVAKHGIVQGAIQLLTLVKHAKRLYRGEVGAGAKHI